MRKIVMIALVLIVLGGMWYFYTNFNTRLLRVCPEAWIQNRMPRIADIPENDPREYFVLNNKRVELKDFDLSWIKENCNIQPKVVQ